MSVKLTANHVLNEFTSKGWKLISSDYNGSQTPLECMCPQGHLTTISWNNFKKGQGCKFCAGNVKFEYNQVKKIFSEYEMNVTIQEGFQRWSTVPQTHLESHLTSIHLTI